jgi:hypothetical protein
VVWGLLRVPLPKIGLKVVNAGGKVMLDTVEQDLGSGHEEMKRGREEFVKILSPSLSRDRLDDEAELQ